MQMHDLINLALNEIKSKPAAIANKNGFYLSDKCYIDKSIMTAMSKHGDHFIYQIIRADHKFDDKNLSFEDYVKEHQKIDPDGNKPGVVIKGITNRITKVKGKPLFILRRSNQTNQTKISKAMLVKSRRYNPIREGKPYREGVENFIQDCAVNGSINEVPQTQISNLIKAYKDVFIATVFSGITKFSFSLEHFEINIAINGGDIEAIYVLIKVIAQILFGEPVLGGDADETYADYFISKKKRLKFYRKIQPSADGKTPGMIRAELVLRKVKFRDEDDLYRVVKQAQDELISLVTYIFNILDASQTVDHDKVEALAKHPDLLLKPVSNQMIPEHLMGCFTELSCKSLKSRFVLKPELFLHFLNKEQTHEIE